MYAQNNTNQTQYDAIALACQFLGLPTPETEEAYYTTWKAIKKHRRQLSKEGIELPKEWKEKLEAIALSTDSYSVINHSKGSSYCVYHNGELISSCECPAWQFRSWCDHASLVQDLIDNCDSLDNQDKKCSSSVDECTSSVVNVNSNTGIYTAQNPDDTSVVYQLCSNVDASTPSKDSPANPNLQCDSWQVIASVLPDGFVLTEDQKNAAISILNWLNDRAPKYDVSDRIALLSGFAGTGKTTLLKTIIKAWRNSGNFGGIAFTAPTAKAVNVLRRTMNGSIDNSAFMTVHKLLELKPVKGNQKKMEFEPDPKKESKFPLYRLVVIDECSMINAELHDYITDAVRLNASQLAEPVKVLFVGDSAQIPPVNEGTLSPTFATPIKNELREVMRYGGAIASYATDLRSNLDAPKPLKPLVKDVNPATGHGIYVAKSESQWMESLIKAFSNPAAQTNEDFVRAIAYTNDRVERINHTLRNHFYPGADEFVVGERLLVQEAYAPDNTVLLENSSEVIVKKVSSGYQGKWKVWYLDLLRSDGTIATVTTLHKMDRDKYKNDLNQLAKDKRWHEFWGLRDAFANLRYCYALTAHKAQGSTFANVYIDFNNIVGAASAKSELSRIRERNQLLYTAVTRAAERLVLF